MGEINLRNALKNNHDQGELVYLAAVNEDIYWHGWECGTQNKISFDVFDITFPELHEVSDTDPHWCEVNGTPTDKMLGNDGPVSCRTKENCEGETCGGTWHEDATIYLTDNSLEFKVEDGDPIKVVEDIGWSHVEEGICNKYSWIQGKEMDGADVSGQPCYDFNHHDCQKNGACL